MKGVAHPRLMRENTAVASFEVAVNVSPVATDLYDSILAVELRVIMIAINTSHNRRHMTLLCIRSCITRVMQNPETL